MNIKALTSPVSPAVTAAGTHTLTDGNLTVGVSDHGAELTSLRSEETGLEYLWQGDPKIWGRRSPILFPIVGRLKDDTYTYEGKTYHMTQHGFARDMHFDQLSKSPTSITFKLLHNEETLEQYPFKWDLLVRYSLIKGRVQVTYEVSNLDTKKPMFFSIGGHPGFRCPLLPSESYEDYRLAFTNEYTCERFFHKDGLMTGEVEPFLQRNHDMQLTRDMFDRGAIISKHPDVSNITLLNKKSGRGVMLSTQGYPYLGIWAIPGADFVCLEPWYGLPDSVGSNQKLEDKEGIERLGPKNHFTMAYSITPF